MKQPTGTVQANAILKTFLAMMSVQMAGYHVETGHRKATKHATILYLVFNLATENVYVMELHAMDSVQRDFHYVH